MTKMSYLAYSFTEAKRFRKYSTHTA